MLKADNKICFVVQRYGLEVNGGAELLCRQLAENMLRFYEVEVLTTKAIDYMSWKDEYSADEETINNVMVKRFAVKQNRNTREFDLINGRFLNGQMNSSEEMDWIEKQGPFVPAMIEYLKKHQYDYKVIIFFTYLYYPTVIGIKNIDQKCIMMPMAHDEPYLRMQIFDDVFLKPDAFYFNTEEERKLVHRKYHNEQIPSDIGGAGVDVPAQVAAEEFYQKYGVSNYIVYVGRIDEAKNCQELFNFFLEYKKRNPGNLKLVLMGKSVIPVPKHDDIISLGFVSEEDKFNGIAGAKALVLPSKFESLSIVVLEAMYLSTPVIVNGACPVLKSHCINSNGAFYYNTYFEFEGEMNYLKEHPDVVEIMTQNAKQYVENNYQWDAITEKLYHLICQITS